MLGVSLATVILCVKAESMAATCPKCRVDVFKIALGKKLTSLTKRERNEVLGIRSIT